MHKGLQRLHRRVSHFTYQYQTAVDVKSRPWIDLCKLSLLSVERTERHRCGAARGHPGLVLVGQTGEQQQQVSPQQEDKHTVTKGSLRKELWTLG